MVLANNKFVAAEVAEIRYRFFMELASLDPQNPQTFRCAALEGHPCLQIATLTATIMHAWFRTPVDVQGGRRPFHLPREVGFRANDPVGKLSV